MIKNMTDASPRPPRIGQLRKGAAKNEKGHVGHDLTYFRFVSDDPEAVAAFESAYGKEPRDVDFYLLSPSAQECFATWQEAYDAGSLLHRCDGETCVRWLDEKTGLFRDDPKPCPSGCKPHGYLDVIIPQLARLAVVTFVTTSVNDIIGIDAALRQVEMLHGDLRGIPFVLRRRQEDVSIPEIGKNGKPTGDRRRLKMWLCSVEVNPQWFRYQLEEMNRKAHIALNMPSLPEHNPPADVDPLTGEVETKEDKAWTWQENCDCLYAMSDELFGEKAEQAIHLHAEKLNPDGFVALTLAEQEKMKEHFNSDEKMAKCSICKGLKEPVRFPSLLDDEDPLHPTELGQ